MTASHWQLRSYWCLGSLPSLWHWHSNQNPVGSSSHQSESLPFYIMEKEDTGVTTGLHSFHPASFVWVVDVLQSSPSLRRSHRRFLRLRQSRRGDDLSSRKFVCLFSYLACLKSNNRWFIIHERKIYVLSLEWSWQHYYPSLFAILNSNT